MDWISILLIIAGLALFEVINSIDNAIINAEILGTMQQKWRKWFLTYGLLIAVIGVRGLLPWAIIWITTPSLGPIGALTAAFSHDPGVHSAIEDSAPIFLMAGGVFLLFLFFHWLFMEPKNYGLHGERFFHQQSAWFYAAVSILLAVIVWFSLKENTLIAFAAVIGSTTFFIIHGFRQTAQMEESKLMEKGRSDLSKIFYLEAIDAAFSIDGVLGAFAFTLSVPLILIGNGLGAFILRELTISNIDTIKKYRYLKNGAMYSILFLGIVMVLDSFGFHIPSWLTPLTTFLIVGYFFFRSTTEMKTLPTKHAK